MRALPVMVVAALVGGAGCGGANTPEAGAPASRSSAPATTSPAVTAPSSAPASPTEEPSPDLSRILDFTGPAVGGGQIRGAEYAGQDVVLWFFAPW
jgi:hypothetical protein